MERDEWVHAFAAAMGVPPPNEQEVEQLLALAGHAAHSSERAAAPLACWVAGRTGRPVAELLAAAREIA